MCLIIFLLFISTLPKNNCDDKVNLNPPNIVIIMADDLGFNDVSFHGSLEIPTKHIDALCYNGVILNRFYTPPLCTPSRSSLMTGKYSTKLGMQHYVIISDEPWGLPLNEKLLPEYFKEAGYRTSLIGKWHLGFHKKKYTPTFRGFDTHFGYLGPYISYFDHSLIMFNRNYSLGYDMRRNLQMVADDVRGQYVTDLFTKEAVNLIREHDVTKPLFMLLTHLAPHAGNEDNPMEAPDDVLEKFSYIKDEQRRKLAAMISVMDEGVGRIVSAINEKGIMDNTIIMFLSDNGGPTRGVHATQASNYPLRGQKASVWEGGCRVPACIYSPLIKNNHRVSNEFIHITDILPTMAAAANIKINDGKLDGVNQWETITENMKSARSEILYNIESVFGFSAIMSDGWKFVNGSENIKNADWFGSSGENAELSFKDYIEEVLNSETAKSLPKLSKSEIEVMFKNSTVECGELTSSEKCNPLKSPCLFDIVNDPCEMNNLAKSHPERVEILLSKLSHHISQMVPSRRKPSDARSDPKYHNSTWTWWLDEENVKNKIENEMDVTIYIICAIFFGFIFFVAIRKINRI